MRLGFVLTLFLFVIAPVQAQGDPATCDVSDNYAEAISEYQLTIFNVLQMSFDPLAPINDPDIAGAYYETLIGMRHYLETQDIPACATMLNAAHIATISAGQDVLALMQFENAPVNAARLHFRQSWGALIEAAQASPLS